MDRFFIAQLGKTVGLWGDLKLHLHTDFPEQFKIGQHYQSDRGSLEIIDIDHTRNTIKFRGYESLESAKRLTNAKLYADQKHTIENCNLQDNERFWFEIIGTTVWEDEKLLGSVTEIQRLMDTDYILIKTDESLVKDGLPSSFLIPYIPRYIIDMDRSQQKIYTKDAIEILEAS
ncbi:16S rRNA processing protein RimM [hydrothermal vent metagenome]|uniref:16S rRNA processing protein RimM n=1 Tax=hydrothermal vent metagenome TaxID=652676 RepID=A0A1W1CFK5_9ZZZZ